MQGQCDYRPVHPRVTLFSVAELVVFLRVAPAEVSRAFLDIYKLQDPSYGKEVGETGEAVQMTDHQWIQKVTDSKQAMVVVVFDETRGALPEGFCVVQARREPVSGLVINTFGVAADAGPATPTPEDRSLTRCQTTAGLLFHATCQACKQMYRELRSIFEEDVRQQQAEVEHNPEGMTAQGERKQYNRSQRRALSNFRASPRYVETRLVLPVWRNSPLLESWFAFKRVLPARKMRVMCRKDWEDYQGEREDSDDLFRLTEQYSMMVVPFRE